MQLSTNANYNFAIPMQIQIKQQLVMFVNYILNDDTAGNVITRYALCLLLDIIRPEFPTRSVRDVLSGYERISKDAEKLLEPQDSATFELLAKKFYTLVCYVICDTDPFATLQKKVYNFCKKNDFLQFYETVLKRNVVIDLLAEPCERLPFARTRTSGKHIPRVIADSKGRVYDIFGNCAENLKYDMKRSIISDNETGLQFVVPNVDCEQELDVNEIFSQYVCISWLYGQIPENMTVTFELEQLLLRSFSKKPIFECFSVKETEVVEPPLFTSEYVFGDKRILPSALQWHERNAFLDNFHSLSILIDKDGATCSVDLNKNNRTYRLAS